MKRIYAILLAAVALSIGSCDIESNAKYTGNYYSANTPAGAQAKTKELPKGEDANKIPEEPKAQSNLNGKPAVMNATGRNSARVTN